MTPELRAQPNDPAWIAAFSDPRQGEPLLESARIWDCAPTAARSSGQAAIPESYDPDAWMSTRPTFCVGCTHRAASNCA